MLYFILKRFDLIGCRENGIIRENWGEMQFVYGNGWWFFYFDFKF